MFTIRIPKFADGNWSGTLTCPEVISLEHTSLMASINGNELEVSFFEPPTIPKRSLVSFNDDGNMLIRMEPLGPAVWSASICLPTKIICVATIQFEARLFNRYLTLEVSRVPCERAKKMDTNQLITALNQAICCCINSPTQGRDIFLDHDAAAKLISDHDAEIIEKVAAYIEEKCPECAEDIRTAAGL